MGQIVATAGNFNRLPRRLRACRHLNRPAFSGLRLGGLWYLLPYGGGRPRKGVAPWEASVPMRILVIEDEKRIAELIARGLENAGYQVDSAEEGAKGLEMAHAQDYDLIILDLMLPDMDGLRVLERLRNRKVCPPILILSALGAVDDRVKGLERGADDYLAKPFSFNELLARVRALLRRGQPLPERLQVGDLVLDVTRRRVSRSGQPIELAPKEFSILEFLMRNAGRPLTRTAIVEHVWEMDYDGLTNIVDVYIRHLRSKIDDRWPQKLIRTVRGIGYMIEAGDRPGGRPAQP